MRPPDWGKWEAAWDHLARGGSKKTAGIHKSLAVSMRRLQELGWTWEIVHRRLQAEPIGLAGLVAEAEGGTPPPVPNPPPSPPPAPPPLRPAPSALTIPAPRPVPARATPAVERETFADRQRARLEQQREHWDRELQIGAGLMELGDRLLAAHKPYILEKKKVSRREAPCPHCRKPVSVEEVHIHPAKVDVQGIVRAYQEGAERTRVALALPRQLLSVKVSDVHSEVADRLRDIDEAFKAAFQHGIERGLVSEQGALEIWERARAQIEGKHA